MTKPKNSMPPNAKMVFKGILFEVWQWEQKMYDGSVQIFERLKRPDTACIIPVVGDKILILKEEQPDKNYFFTCPPAGRVEPNEDPLDAAKRELLEETGYVSDNWVLFKANNPVSKIEWTIHTFIAHNCTFKQAPKLDGGEKIETRLISFDELLLLPEDPSFLEKDLGETLLRVRLDEKSKQEFYNLLFGKKP